MLVIAAPGQGAQAPGFLTPWLDLPGFADRVAAWSDLAGCDLVRYGTTAGAEEITDTAIAQPLLVAAAIAAAEVLSGDLGQVRTQAGIAAGHSVGELAAGAIAGVLSAEDAMSLVGVRGRAMAKAAAAEATGMTAILGGDQDEVLAALDSHGLTPANVNGAGQIVAAGTMAQLGALAAAPPAGARLRPLTWPARSTPPTWRPPSTRCARRRPAVAVQRPRRSCCSPTPTGRSSTSGRDWLERIVTQVSAPVRWDECMHSMSGLGVTALIELPPGGTLTGLARRALPGLARAALKTPDDLDGRAHAAGRARDAGAAATAAASPEWRLLVAPLAGTFRAGADGQDAAPGAHVRPGARWGTWRSAAGQQHGHPAFAGTIVEWLVEDGDPVAVGQPLVRLQPESA